ncbi:MAG TPA: hypothetical protein PK499_09125 [Flavobacteriales bacterium]|nr:hypothetical protein [Flavobacteriales bacterium]
MRSLAMPDESREAKAAIRPFLPRALPLLVRAFHRARRAGSLGLRERIPLVAMNILQHFQQREDGLWIFNDLGC